MSDQDPNVANLPGEPEVTRRDFVGGTLVGTGAALLAMASPGAVRTAQLDVHFESLACQCKGGTQASNTSTDDLHG
jgi:hypothetical protein